MAGDELLAEINRRLSVRQREVFVLAANGLSNAQIAERMEVSIKTVQTFRASVNRRLGIHGPAELLVLAARAGLIRGIGEPPPSRGELPHRRWSERRYGAQRRCLTCGRVERGRGGLRRSDAA
jgi:DNA-binding CsgD family transcriptional regulator